MKNQNAVSCVSFKISILHWDDTSEIFSQQKASPADKKPYTLLRAIYNI